MPPPPPSLPPPYRLSWHDALDSTNDEAKRRAAAGETGPLWIVADRQTKGRGRHGRTWQTLSGNLAATLLFTPHVPVAEAARLSFLAALAVADVIDTLAPGCARLKWPNDILVRGRKIAGILLEAGNRSGSPSASPWVAIGIGINLAAHPDHTAFPATSLAREGLASPSVSEAFELLVSAVESWLKVWREEGFSPIRSAWLARATGLGSQIEVRLPEQRYKGRFVGLDEDGALTLEEADGTFRRINAGEIYFR